MDPDPLSAKSILLFQWFFVSPSNLSFFYIFLAVMSLLLLFSLQLASNYIASLQEDELEYIEEEHPTTFLQLSKCYLESNRLGMLFIVAQLLMAALFIVSLYFFLVPYCLSFFVEGLLIFSILGVFSYLLPSLFSKYSATKFRLALLFSFPVLRVSVPLANAFVTKEKSKPTSDISLADLETVLPTTEKEQAKPSIANLNLYRQVLRFDKIKIRHVMRLKKELEGINANYNFGEVLRKIKASSHSRLPVYDPNWSKIHGIIHCKDLLPHTEKEQLDWQKLIRPVIYVQERDNAQAVLRKFQQTKNHMALVLNSSKRLVGLVTLEDLTEEIIGEIEDE